jgi:hypothetical protein
MVMAKRDHVGAHQPIGGETADKEGHRQQPEDPRSGSFSQSGKGGFQRIAALTHFYGVIGIGAERNGPDIGGRFRQQKEHQRHQQRHGKGDAQDDRLPAMIERDRRKHRQENQRAGGGGGRKQPITSPGLSQTSD